MSDIKQLRDELRAVKREMKERGVRRISCFNAGLTPEESRYNTRLFELNTKIGKALK